MYRKMMLKEIRGVVYEDINGNGVMDKSEKPLKNIEIRLYHVGEIYRQKAGKGITVLGESILARARTDERGEFYFAAGEGEYTLHLDVSTLPAGMGVREENRKIGIGERGFVNFAVEEVYSIETENLKNNALIGEELVLHPVAKNRKGDTLSAKIDFFQDGQAAEIRHGRLAPRPKTFESRGIHLKFGAGSVSKDLHLNYKMPELCRCGKIQLAHRLGMLDGHKRVLYLLYSLFEKRRLPEEYGTGIPVKSGTTAVEEIRRYVNGSDADRDITLTAKRYLNNPVPKLDKVYKSPEGFFNIHYTLSGENAVSTGNMRFRGVPPYIAEVGAAFENVREITCVQRGFRFPLNDKGKTAMDIYVYDLKGIYGITYASEYKSGQPGMAGTASSYICIDNSYSSKKGFDKRREECMKVTAAHEFFHSVQYAYNVEADTWWKEASATWNEDEVYKGVNDYVRYLESFFSSPGRPLDESSYGGVIFVKYLSEKMGGHSMIKRIWEMQTVADSSIKSVDGAVREAFPGTDLGMVFNRFTAANFNPSQYYSEGASWGISPTFQNTYSSYPVISGTGNLKHLSSEYQLFRPDVSAKGKTLSIMIDGDDSTRWGFKLQNRKSSDKLCSMVEISASMASFNRAEIRIGDFGETYEETCLIPANLERSQDGVSYNYSASIL